MRYFVLAAAVAAGNVWGQAGSRPAAAPGESALFSFTGVTGSSPSGGLIFNKYGSLFGCTYFGGTADQGTVFEMTPPPATGGNWTESVLYSLAGGTDGSNCSGDLVFDSKGSLYGATLYGGASNAGTIFQLKPPPVAGGSWTETVLYTFTGMGDGGLPTGSLLFRSGVLYGTAISGGAGNNGVVFALQPPTAAGGAWSYSVLYSFAGGSDGATPAAGLALGAGGTLFGTTYLGGGSNYGTVFQLTPPAGAGQAWTETVIYSFTGGSDGANPRAPVTWSNGALYGTATYGGTGRGTAFELSQATAGGPWTFTLAHTFGSGQDGANPYGKLVMNNGWIFGTTAFGGLVSNGVVYGIKPPAMAGGAWSESVFYNFMGQNGDGAEPVAGLARNPRGVLYGTTYLGGTNGDGTVFELIL